MKNKKRRVVINVGGTAGHIYPGICVADELCGSLDRGSIYFLVDKRPLAARVLKSSGYRYYRISSAPLPRKKVWHICRFIFRMSLGVLESVIRLRKINPGVVMAFGAYTSVPVVIAAKIMRIPVVLHEQNYFPGMANKFLALFADRIAVSFCASRSYFPSNKTVLTGNPVRKSLFEVTREESIRFFDLSADRITILVFGGSLGSQAINLSMLGMLPYLDGVKNKIQFVHICGRRNYEKVKREYQKEGFKAKVYKYITRMEYAYGACDIVIARAGATTVAEISALGKPAVLVPYPEAASQHQLLNAKPLRRAGAALSHSEEQLSGEGLALRLIPIIKEPGVRGEMGRKAAALGERFKTACERLSREIIRYV